MDAATRSRAKARRSYVMVPASAICYPGVYVTHRGRMVRVFDEALASPQAPVLGWDSIEGTLVTLISEDPRTPLALCRMLAEDAGLSVSF